MNQQVILVMPVFAFLFLLLLFVRQSEIEMVYVPLHRELDPEKYKVISVDTVYNDTLDYKIIKYKER